jgi:hypothetical protein
MDGYDKIWWGRFLIAFYGVAVGATYLLFTGMKESPVWFVCIGGWLMAIGGTIQLRRTIRQH